MTSPFVVSNQKLTARAHSFCLWYGLSEDLWCQAEVGECEGQAHQSKGGQVDSSTQAGPKIDILAETYNHQSLYAYQTKYPAKTNVSS